ncbi:hypothetical protein HYFRA_00008356 [Hymenoscyphus fraxineus]|uniref:Protein kinase domain-containing protein n=1 Tax=Hymenoscyphus fraxineus TaxID=746836 RepID=A0A9N9PKN9_9HELO|nr:hypothetical protein HYFRA_00008356 [Hymenoscyphus fraxineus]
MASRRSKGLPGGTPELLERLREVAKSKKKEEEGSEAVIEEDEEASESKKEQEESEALDEEDEDKEASRDIDISIESGKHTDTPQQNGMNSEKRQCTPPTPPKPKKKKNLKKAQRPLWRLNKCEAEKEDEEEGESEYEELLKGDDGSGAQGEQISGNESEEEDVPGRPRGKGRQQDGSIPEILAPLFDRTTIEGFRSENPIVYAMGRLPPVHLGDIYNSRYRIIQKIGSGSYSTVWLALDLHADSRHVALKFLTAGKVAEVNMHKFFAMTDIDDNQYDREAGREFVMEMLDSFEITRNGKTYWVIVSEVLVPLKTLYSTGHYRRRIDTKRDFFQIAQGLAFLHHRGATHGDLWYANLALRLPNFRRGFETNPPFPKLIPIIPKTPTEKDFRKYPKYLVSSDFFRGSYIEDLLKEAKKSGVFEDARVQIIDMSNAYTRYRDHVNAMQSTVRAPEFTARALNGNPGIGLGGFPSDIWALACTMFKFVFKEDYNLFDHTQSPNFFLWEIERKIGPIPQRWHLGGRPVGGPPGSMLDGMTPALFWMGLRDTYQFQHLYGPFEWIDGFLALLRRMLVVDPRGRLNIDEVVADEWFDDVRDEEESSDSE